MLMATGINSGNSTNALLISRTDYEPQAPPPSVPNNSTCFVPPLQMSLVELLLVYYSRGVVVILQAECEVVVVLVGVRALWDLGLVVLVRRPCSGGRVGSQIRVVVRVVRLEMKSDSS